MRRSLLASIWLAALLLAACGEAATPTPEDAVASARLPSVGTVGDLPAVERRLVVGVDARGRITSKSGVTDLRGLDSILQDEIRRVGRFGDEGYARLYVVLRLDASLPWEVASVLLHLCDRSDVRVYRRMFGVRSEADGAEGAMGAFGVPEWNIQGPMIVPAETNFQVLRVTDDPGRLVPEVLFTWASEAALLGDPLVGAVLRPSATVSVGVVLAATDALRRAGVPWVDFAPSRTADATEATALETRAVGRTTALEDYVASHPSSGDRGVVTRRGLRLHLAGERRAMPVLARVRGRLAGVPSDEADDERASSGVRTPPSGGPLWRRELLDDLDLLDRDERPEVPGK